MKEARNESLLHVLKTRDMEQGRGILKEFMLIENKFKNAGIYISIRLHRSTLQ